MGLPLSAKLCLEDSGENFPYPFISFDYSLPLLNAKNEILVSMTIGDRMKEFVSPSLSHIILKCCFQ